MLELMHDDAAPDSLKLHCRLFLVSETHDVIHLERDGTETGSILAVVMTQPDFTTLTETQADGNQASHLFVVEYVIQ